MVKQMESVSFASTTGSSSTQSFSWFSLVSLFLLRPLLALLLVLSILLIGWVLAWKLVLVHVPLVQEIFGLRKKPRKERPPPRRRIAQFYKSLNEAGLQSSSS